MKYDDKLIEEAVLALLVTWFRLGYLTSYHGNTVGEVDHIQVKVRSFAYVC
ncbi:hypothetical protein IFR35_14915 [Pseudomonas fluorescens]|uniref:hypothetical protein n=1 Tax=Pseudomonas TaxID=286 RepID=UPI0017850A9E|nr:MULTISPECIES: hypothetical protein [Pseudomonas]MBD8192413.1 hypothetical protein [Pseudomonas fluorescens]MBD8227538.1 hypothetical protein [Pseudomonas fluorescens]MBD8785504.1 hypothetical protein [Pseudomonas fluorescens]MBD8817733.1 hypothetical protein [Pseudomonas fluorescens]MCM2364781.1 hypothetical protein [Pseudomonas sp. SR18]